MDAGKATCLALWAAALTMLCSGCAWRARQAERVAGRMLDPGTPLRAGLRLRQELRRLTPESDGYLASAFFPIGLYDVPESALHEVAAAGFNLVVNAGKDARYLRRAEGAGLKVIPYVNTAEMARDVARVGARRSVLAGYLWDEPDLNKLAPATYHALAEELRGHDPSRPIYLTVWSPRRYSDFVASCDILAPNPYPIRRLEASENRLMEVGEALDCAGAVAGERPVWAIIQAFWAEPLWPRNPTPAELRAMVFLAINHGADGIIYFSYKSGDRAITEQTALFAEIRRVNGQINALRGALLAPRVQPPPAYGEHGSDPLGQAGIDFSLRRFAGATLFIAVNPHAQSSTVTLDPAQIARGEHCVELFGADAARAGALVPGKRQALSFDPHQVRIFWIE